MTKMVTRARFAKGGTSKVSSTTTAVESRRRFSRPLRRKNIPQTQVPTQEELRQQAIAKGISEIDKQIAFQQQVIRNIEAVIAQRNQELVSAEGDRVSLLRDRNDRDRDRINDVRTVIQNLQNNRTAVASGEVTGSSVVRQSIAIGSESERIRTERKATGTTLQAERAKARLAERFEKKEITQAEFESQYQKQFNELPLITRIENVEAKFITEKAPDKITPRDILLDATKNPLKIPFSETTLGKAIEDPSLRTDFSETTTSIQPVNNINLEAGELTTLEAFKASGENLLFNIKRGFKTREEREQIPIKDIFAPLRFTDPLTSKFNLGLQQRGTFIDPDSQVLPSAQQSTIGLTASEIELKQLTAPQFLKQTEGEAVFKDIKQGITTAALVGASALGSPALLGTKAIPELSGTAGTFLLGSGTKQIALATAPQRYTLNLETNEFEPVIKPSERIKRGLAGTAQIFGGSVAIYGSALAYDTIDDILTIQGLENQKLFIVGRELERTSKGSVFKLRGTRQYGTATQDVKIRLPVFKQAGKEITGFTESGEKIVLESAGQPSFRVVGGKINAQTTFYSVARQQQLTSNLNFGLTATGSETGSQYSQLVKGGKTSTQALSGKTKGAAGEGILSTKKSADVNVNVGVELPFNRLRLDTTLSNVKPGELIEFKFAGITGESDDVIKFIAGQQRTLRVYNPRVTVSGSRTDIVGGETLTFKPQTEGIVARLKQTDIKTDVNTITKGSIVSGMPGEVSNQIKDLITKETTKQTVQTTAALSSISTPATIVTKQGIKSITSQISPPATNIIATSLSASSLTGVSRQSKINQSPIGIQSPSVRGALDEGIDQGTTSIQIPNFNQIRTQSIALTQAVSSAQIPRTAQEQSNTFVSPPVTPTIIQFPFNKTPTPKIPFIFKFKTGGKKTTPKFKDIGIEVKRGGKFRQIGRAPSLSKAFALGSKRVQRDLSATFRLKPAKGAILDSFKLPKQIRRKKGKKLTFIERKEFRLDTPTELKQIKLARLKL